VSRPPDAVFWLLCCVFKTDVDVMESVESVYKKRIVTSDSPSNARGFFDLSCMDKRPNRTFHPAGVLFLRVCILGVS